MTAPRRPSKQKPKLNSKVTELVLTIDSLNDDGLGVAIHEGRTVLVFDALPGEKVVVRVLHDGRQQIIAETRKVLHTSPARSRQNRCPHFRACQGCAMLNWAYPMQLEYKQQRVTNALQAYPALAEVPVRQIWGATELFGYRASAKLVVARKRSKGLVGLYRRGSHDVVDIADCPLHHPLINQIAAVVRQEIERGSISAYNPLHGRGLLRYLLIRVSPANNKAMVTFVTKERNYREVTHLAKWLQRKMPEVVSIHQNVNSTTGNVIIGRETFKMLGLPDLIDVIGDVRLHLGPTSFLQVNHAQAARIYRFIKDLCRLQADQDVLDLYCGVGGISLHLAGHARQVLGVEMVAEAVRHAQVNAKMNGYANCRFVAGNVEALLAGEMLLTDKIAAVVVNPPRSGCEPIVLDRITALRPHQLVYVSCDPVSLARDLDRLVSWGFQVKEIQPVDMFPQTPHVENVAHLSFSASRKRH